MAFKPFVCKTLRFSAKICHTPSLSCSPDGYLSFTAENGVYILVGYVFYRTSDVFLSISLTVTRLT